MAELSPCLSPFSVASCRAVRGAAGQARPRWTGAWAVSGPELPWTLALGREMGELPPCLLGPFPHVSAKGSVRRLAGSLPPTYWKSWGPLGEEAPLWGTASVTRSH